MVIDRLRHLLPTSRSATTEEQECHRSARALLDRIEERPFVRAVPDGTGGKKETLDSEPAIRDATTGELRDLSYREFETIHDSYSISRCADWDLMKGLGCCGRHSLWTKMDVVVRNAEGQVVANEIVFKCCHGWVCPYGQFQNLLTAFGVINHG